MFSLVWKESWNLPLSKCHPVVLAWPCISVQHKNIFPFLKTPFWDVNSALMSALGHVFPNSFNHLLNNENSQLLSNPVLLFSRCSFISVPFSLFLISNTIIFAQMATTGRTSNHSAVVGVSMVYWTSTIIFTTWFRSFKLRIQKSKKSFSHYGSPVSP